MARVGAGKRRNIHACKQELHSAHYAKIKSTAVSVKNEVMEMIARVRERKGRLDLQIVSGKRLRKIFDKIALQSADNAEKFITTRKIDSRDTFFAIRV